MAAIEAVVDDMLANVGGDDRINAFFANTDLPRLRTQLVELVCQGSGGPCTYTGRSMAETHAGMGITDADFTALVEDLVMALDTLMVPDREKNELLAILGPMQPDIVQMPAPAAPAPAPAAPAAPPPAAPAQPMRASVEIRGFAYNPASLTVSVGSTVTWANADSVTHTATGPGFDTRNIGPGQSGTATFSTAGQISYRCTIHPSIQGVIVVQ
jgi:hemoglobin